MPQLQQDISEEGQQAQWRSEAPRTSTPADNAPATASTDARSTTSTTASTTTSNPTAESRNALPKERKTALGDPLNGGLPAAARHVRPDELLAAIAALEARKGEVIIGTMPIGEALDRMQAGADAEEVWQEIALQRSQQRNTRKVSDFEAQRRRKRWGQSVAGLAAVFATAIALRFLAGDIKKMEPVAPVVPTKTLTGTIPQTQRYPVSGSVFIRSASAIPLSELPQGKPIWMSLNDIQTLDLLLNGDSLVKPLSEQQLQHAYFDPTQAQDTMRFQVVWRDKQAYIQGYTVIPPGGTVATLVRKPLAIYNRRDHPELTGGDIRKIEIPREGFRSYDVSGSGEFFKLTITDIQGVPLGWDDWDEVTPPVQARRPGQKVTVAPGTRGVPALPRDSEMRLITTDKRYFGFGRSIEMDLRKPYIVSYPKKTNPNSHSTNSIGPSF